MSTLGRGLLFAACLLALAGCGGSGATTIVQDVTVRLDPSSERSPLEGPSARLSSAAKEVRELLGHPIAVELDAAVAPRTKEGLDAELTRAFEVLATELAKWKTRAPSAYELARRRLQKLEVRYDPGAVRRDLSARFEGDGVVVTKSRKDAGETIPVGVVLELLERTSREDDARDFASLDPASVPEGSREAYVRWLAGTLGEGTRNPDAYRQRALARIPLAVRFDAASGDAHAESIRRILIDGALPSIAYEQLGRGPEVDRATDALAGWLEQRFDRFSEAWRKRAMDVLLARGMKNPRLVEPAARLSARVVDAWAKAGHPLPGDRSRIPGDFETVVCPRPKDARDGRSLGPRCDGGIVRLLLTSDPSGGRLGAFLAARKDPILVEHVFVSAGYSTYGGDSRKLVALLRAIEAEPALLRAGLRVVAEDHAEGSTVDLWLAEVHRLWLARPGARGTLLYLLAHLDPYGNGRVDFAGFAKDVGAPVNAAEAKAYLDEGYRAISLAHVVWPSFGPGFSRAALLSPRLDAYLEEPRVRVFRMRDPHEALVQIRHRLCDEEAEPDLRALGAAIAASARAKPGRALDGVATSFDPKTCDPPCAETRDGTCVRRMRPDEVAKRRKERGR